MSQPPDSDASLIAGGAAGTASGHAGRHVGALFVDPGPGDHRTRRNGDRCPDQQRRAGAARRSPGIWAGLVRRAPQHGLDRVVGDERVDRPHRSAHVHHPAGRRWRDVAEPLAPHDRRAIRHARDPAPGAYRSRPRPGAGKRSEHDASDAARRPLVRPLPRRRARTPGLPPRRVPYPGRRRRTRRRDERAAVHPRFVAVRRPPRRDAGSAVRVRLALRAGGADRRDLAVPPRVPPVGTAQ